MPPISTQRAIAEILGALDDLIEANCTSYSLAERLIDSLFERLMLSACEHVSLMDAVRFTFGEPFRSKDFNDESLGRPLIRIRDLKTFSPQLFTTEARERETVVQPGDVIVGMDAEFRPTIWCGREGLLNQRVCRATPRLGGRAFAFKLLAKPLNAVESYKTGTTVSHLNMGDLEQIIVPVPDQPILSNFEQITDPLYWSIVELHEENRHLARLRDTLLPKLLSGEIEIGDAEQLVGKAV
jgi:type I restriction enzyme S subunit